MLALEEERKPERKSGAVWGSEGRNRALLRKIQTSVAQGKVLDSHDAGQLGWYLFLQGMLGLWGATHPEQLESVQSLAGNDGHHLHLANKSDFGRR